MSVKVPTAIRTLLSNHVSGAGVVPIEEVCQAIIDAIDSGACGGGLVSSRTLTDADPAALTLGTAPTKLLGPWTHNMESKGVTSAFSTASITIGPDGAGHYDLDLDYSFKGTAGRRYLFGMRVVRGGVAQPFETERAERTTMSATEVVNAGCTGRMINLLAGDVVEPWGMADVNGSTFIARQLTFRLIRVDSP
jgi:hypothetical protein